MASRDRERDFPVTSIGRTSGSRFQQSVPQDSHPLGLGPSPSPPDASSPGTISSGFTQKYRPYTPRQRGPPTPVPATAPAPSLPTVTPGTLIHPPSPQHHQPLGGGDATTKLQLTNAKAEAQNVGLDTSSEGGASIGWTMLEKIVSENETGEVWAEVWSAIASGKATMMLPVEPLSSSDRLTPEFFKDHIAFSDSSSSSSSRSTPIVTLSGLRGTLHGNTVTFTSTLHPASPLFKALQDSNTRTSALRKLPPLPCTSSTTFPSFTITNGFTILPLPPKTHAPKPPLPPRPGARPISTISTTATSSTSSTSSSHSRIPNPFASFFANRPSTPTPAPPPQAQTSLTAATAATTSPTVSISSLEPLPSVASSQVTVDPQAVLEVNVLVIQKNITRKEVGKEINKSVRRDAKTSLLHSHDRHVDVAVEMPEWVLDRVLEFCEPWFPFVRAPKTISSSKLSGVGGGRPDREKAKDKDEWIVNPVEVESFDDTVDFAQEFYAQLEDYLHVELDGLQPSSTSPAGEDEKEMEADHAASGTMESEQKIRGILEVVEKTICSLFYDRLFSQPQTDDSSHDATLSNRIAALNLLDLTLEHLDIAVDQANPETKGEVDGVVKLCGSMLCGLDKAHTPKEKARILVDAHQVVVDGLSKLPPVRLMSPEESKALKEATLAKSAGVVEELTPSVVVSQNSPPHPPTKAETETHAQVASAELSPLSLATTSELPSTSAPASPASTAPMTLPTDTSSSPDPSSSSLSDPPGSKANGQQPTPVSSDILLPMLIFSVVKSNPPHFVSNLLFLQRFRHKNVYMKAGNGEESFCLINMLAVAEFLEGVDLEGLGLGGASIASSLSAAELTPIITRSQTPTTPTVLTPKSLTGIDISASSFRGKVEQQVDAIAGSANKVISGVVDSSFGILRSFLPQQQDFPDGTASVPSVNPEGVGVDGGAGEEGAGGPTTAKPGQGFGLLKRETVTGFSIASLAASLPMPISSRGGKRQSGDGEEGSQLMDVVSSRPGSMKSFRSGKSRSGGPIVDEEGSTDEDSGDGEGSSEESDESESGDDVSEEDGGSGTGSEGEVEEDESEVDTAAGGGGGVDIPGIQINSPYQRHHPYANSSVARNASASAGSFGPDTRSIRSFESMLSDSKKDKLKKKKEKEMEKKLKQLKKESEKEKKREEKRERSRMRMREKAVERGGPGKNVSVTATKASVVPRKSLTDRLASVSVLAGGVKGSPPDSRRSSTSLLPSTITECQSRLAAAVPVVLDQQLSVHARHLRHGASPSSSRAESPSAPLPLSRSPSPLPRPPETALPDLNMDSTLPSDGKLAPLNKRFMECSVDELTIGEVGELLVEYRRLAEGVRMLGGFTSE